MEKRKTSEKVDMTDERLERIDTPLKEWIGDGDGDKAALLLIGEQNEKGEWIVRVSRGGGSSQTAAAILYDSIVSERWLRIAVIEAVLKYIEMDMKPESDSKPESQRFVKDLKG